MTPRRRSVALTRYCEAVSDAPPPPETPPPPPPASRPPPPPSPPGPSATDRSSGSPRVADHDNPIAVAGLVVAVLALVLSIIVVGFLIAVVSFVLCVVGLRRARRHGLRGRGLAIGGIVLSLLAMAFSVVGLLFLVALVRSGDTIVRDGIATTSDNTEYPPQDDIDQVECGASNSGRLAQARVTITNRSEGRSVYQITIEWDADVGPIEEIITTGFLDAGDTATFQAVDLGGRARRDSCRVTEIERSFLPFSFL